MNDSYDIIPIEYNEPVFAHGVIKKKEANCFQMTKLIELNFR